MINKYFVLFFFLTTVINLTAQNTSQVEYQSDDSDFPNPGRGFYHADDRLDPETISQYPQEGITLVFREYHIDDFKDTALPVSYLWNIQRDFDNVRNAGLKIIPRFRYTARTSRPYGDAPPDIVLKHIKQLTPVLKANSDVMLTFQAGFIGAWGEWYYTDYFSEMPGVISEQNWIDRRAVVDALLEALPPEIQVNVRTPYYKKHLLQEDSYIPVTEQEAYSNAPVARISHHNDCFLANSSDMGTYRDTTIEKPYLAEDTKYTIIGGETCGQSSCSHCENALKELKRFHWTYLNRDYNTGVLNDWINEGCFDEIKKKLGYRYRLINGEFTTVSNPEGVFLFKLNLVNDGFANPSNPMEVAVILKSTSGSKEYIATINDDLRFWPINDTIKLDYSFGLPERINEGDYDVYLRITDVNPTIKGKPAYSIRLANQDVWNGNNGYNNLNHTLTVTNTQSTRYNGGNFFDEKDKTLYYNNHIFIDGVDNEWWRYPVVWSQNNEHAQKLKVTNNADSLYFLIKGNEQGEETEIYVDADNNQSTGWNSFDYKITCCKLFYYSNNDNWEEITGVVPNYAGNGEVKELGIDFSDFSQIALGNNFGVRVKSGEDYLPGNNDPGVKVQRNTINKIPSLKLENEGNTNTLFWNRNLEDVDCYVVVTRCIRGRAEYGGTQLAILPNHIISYQDKNVEPGVEFEYVACYLKGNNRSLPSFSQNVIVQSDEQDYIDIKLDGSPDDWKLCKPVATGEKNNIFKVFRFFNTSDSLFYSLNLFNGTIENYQLMINLDGQNGFEYIISNDSLFHKEDEVPVFIKKIPSFKNEMFLESGLKLSDIGLDTIDYFTASVFINGNDVWGNGEEFSYLKYPALVTPENFMLKVSSDNPYHRIKVKWGYDKNPDKYVIERSTDDSLHFNIIAKVKSSTSYYLDDDVDSSHIYYYRMFSYKDMVRSHYTRTLWMKPGIAGINSFKNSSGNINIYPNPANDRTIIDIELNTRDKITLAIISMSGKEIKTIYRGMIIDKQQIELSTIGMQRGIYFLRATGSNTFMIKKIVIQ